MCCFDLLNCYIYEASKKWRNRQMKREQVLALYDAYADSVYRVALGYLRLLSLIKRGTPPTSGGHRYRYYPGPRGVHSV